MESAGCENTAEKAAEMFGDTQEFALSSLLENLRVNPETATGMTSDVGDVSGISGISGIPIESSGGPQVTDRYQQLQDTWDAMRREEERRAASRKHDQAMSASERGAETDNERRMRTVDPSRINRCYTEDISANLPKLNPENPAPFLVKGRPQLVRRHATGLIEVDDNDVGQE